MITYMFENMLHFLEPVLTVFAAITVITLAVVVCIGCFAIAFKVGDCFKGMLKERYAGCRNKWKMRISKFADYLGEKVGITMGQEFDKVLNAPVMVEPDVRKKMVGSWQTNNSDSFRIDDCDGFFKMSVFELPSCKRYQWLNFVLRSSLADTDRKNLVYADSDEILSLAYSEKSDTIYIPEMNLTFKRCPDYIDDEGCQHVSIPKATQDLIQEIIKVHVDPLYPETSGTSFDEIEDAVNRNVIE